MSKCCKLILQACFTWLIDCECLKCMFECCERILNAWQECYKWRFECFNWIFECCQWMMLCVSKRQSFNFGGVGTPYLCSCILHKLLTGKPWHMSRHCTDALTHSELNLELTSHSLSKTKKSLSDMFLWSPEDWSYIKSVLREFSSADG